MIGAPVKLLYESKHHIVTVEMKTGEMFRGYLADAEDTMNVRLDDVTMYSKDGRSMPVEQVYLRGSQVRHYTLSDVFKDSPLLKSVQYAKSRFSNSRKKSRTK